MLLTTTLPTAIALSVLSVLALKAAWRARRSRRVGDHPHCAACDRDLFGLPAKTERCPECGADLRANSAVRKGAPRPNWLAQAVAVMVAVVLCGVATPNWRAVEWTPIGIHLAPTSWLIRQTNSSSATASLAANELDRRVQKDVYGEKQLEQVMRALYAVDVFLRDANGVEVALGDLSASRRGSQSSIQASPAALAALKGWNSAQGDIILRPSVQAARKTTYLTKIWGEEIVLKNVPVVRDAPAADLSPTTQP
jgi:hypothetical protein